MLRYVIIKYYRKFSCIVMDGTMGTAYYACHMNFEENKKLKKELEKRGAVNEYAKFVVTHITHNHTAMLHEETEAFFAESGIVPAYDGMILEV